MPFKLRSQVGSGPEKSPMDRFKKQSDRNPQMQKSLTESNKVVEKSKQNKKAVSIGDKVSQDLDADPIVKSAIQIIDPTGVSSYGDVKKAWSDNKFNGSDIIEPLGALPVIGKFGKLIKGAKIGSDYLKVSKASKVLSTVNKASDVITAASTKY